MMSDNEQNNEKRETLADIIREKRERAKEIRANLSCVPVRRDDQIAEAEELEHDADQIDAAWKREREELDKRISDLESYAKLWTVRADELRLKCDEFYAKAKHVGNAAAMREALEFCLRIIGENGIRGNVFLGDIQEAHRAITAALSAPARNCDLYDNKTDAELGFVGETGEDDRNPLYWQLFANWLFDTAEERKKEMATKTQALQGALSDLLDSLYDMGIDEDTVAIAAESRKNRESLHSDVLLQRIVAAKAALAMPMRNCDVGTAEEQTKRFSDFCAAHRHTDLPMCAGCALENTPSNTGCSFAWAQMPCEATEGGAQ